ncbi:hypothetical protein M407DRAFT_25376 [Tulasnella calospora MUT 4182]|uniref:Uncharacterized protein n=1 Tax=Tulasnella calospora MUT 4182 TaxID=1051891 RepID=A0A0C3LV36_9AGAM|nr:hypothetical protein M407DRAFT_25376 [Tulasnella calospora MUT 4182]
MFGHLFRSRRSTAGPQPELKTGPSSPEKTAAKPPSRLSVKLQELKYTLHLRRPSKTDGKPARQEQKPRHRYIPYSQRFNRPRQHPGYSTAAGSLQAGAPSTIHSAVPQSSFPANASSAPPAPTTRTTATAPLRLPGAFPTSQPEDDYPPARKRIIEIRAMKANLQHNEAQGTKAVRRCRVQVVAPPTTTTIQQSTSDTAARGFAEGQLTLAAKAHAKDQRRNEERKRLGADLYHAPRRFPESEMTSNDPKPEYKDVKGLRNLSEPHGMKDAPTQQGVLDPESDTPSWPPFSVDFAPLVERAYAVKIEREERQKRSPNSPRQYQKRNPQTAAAQAPLSTARRALKFPNQNLGLKREVQPSLPTIDGLEDSDNYHEGAPHDLDPHPSLWMGQKISPGVVLSQNQDSSQL